METQHPEVEQLSAYLDDELPEVELAALGRHLAACSQCTGELDRLRRAVQTLRALPAAAPPRSFALAAAPARPAGPRWAIPHLMRAFSGVAAALMVTVLVVDAVRPVALTATGELLSAPAAAPAAERPEPASGAADAALRAQREGAPAARPEGTAGQSAVTPVATATPRQVPDPQVDGSRRFRAAEPPPPGGLTPTQVAAIALGAFAALLLGASFLIGRRVT